MRIMIESSDSNLERTFKSIADGKLKVPEGSELSFLIAKPRFEKKGTAVIHHSRLEVEHFKDRNGEEAQFLCEVSRFLRAAASDWTLRPFVANPYD